MFTVITCIFFTMASASQLLLVGQGQRRLLATPGREAVVIEQNQIVRLRDLGNKIEIRGLRPGRVSLRVGHRIYDVFVLASAHESLQNDLQRLQGVRWNFVADQFVVEGELWRFSDWLKLSKQLKNTPFLFQAQIDPEIAVIAKNYFYGRLRTLNLPLPSAPMDLPRPVHFGQLAEPQKLQIQNFFKSYGLKVIFDSAGLSLEPLIRLRLVMAEVNQQFSRELGLHWQNDFGAQLLPKTASQGSLSLQLKTLEQNGQGQVLASPNLVCRSGGEAQFLAGGEFPIRTQSFEQNHVTWKKHGVLLKFRPRADSSQHITLHMVMEVSMIDPSQVVDGVPGLKTNRVESQLNFLSSKTIALSGLLRNNKGQSTEGLALLRQIPILGSLFQSKSYLENRSELVVFVTPTIEHLEGPADTIALPKPWQEQEFLGDL